MKQSYIDFIEKTVRAKCPELQKLSFGCHIIVGIHEFVYNESEAHNMLISLNHGKYEILGHPIHLEHILRTMGRDMIFAGNGDMYKGYRDFEDGIIACEYNLSLSWKDQSEETLKFLAETMGFNS